MGFSRVVPRMVPRAAGLFWVGRFGMSGLKNQSSCPAEFFATINEMKRISESQDLLTEKQAAHRYGVSLSWLKRARFQKNGPDYYIRDWIVSYPTKETDAWFKSHKVKMDLGGRRAKLFGGSV